MSKWLNFTEYPNPGNKTKRIVISNKATNTDIGAIYWGNGWRKYIFHPFPATIWDVSCMQDIIEFINNLMNERNKGG